jgi:hypothetical protein
VLSDVAKRIELEYFRSIKGKDFGPATNKSVAKNVDSKTFEQLRSRIDYHNSLYEDVNRGIATRSHMSRVRERSYP